MNFDDDFLEAMRAAYARDDMHGAGPLEEAEEEARTEDGTVDPDGSTVYSFGGGGGGGGASASPHAPSVSERPRRRGSRGGSTTSKRSASRASEKKNSAVSNGDFKRWRSGQVPPAPVFEGDVELDPDCLRHYKHRLSRWIRITREFLPPNEQALRAREQLRGEAELELEEVPDDRYDHPDGVAHLLEDLEVSFGERELFRQGGVIREFESICRLQGESVTAFVRRFRLLERKLQDNKVPAYPEEARVVKLLDGRWQPL